MKRIIFSVVSVHLVVIGWMAFYSVVEPPPKKPLQIKTVVKATPAPSALTPVAVAAAAPSPCKESPPVAPKAPRPVVEKKPAATQKADVKNTPAAAPKKQPPKQPTSKKPIASASMAQALAQKLEDSLAKWEESPPGKANNTKARKQMTSASLAAPTWVAHLNVEQTGEGESDSYVSRLVDCLKETLDLPEKGKVKIALTLQSNQRFVKLEVLESGSERNRQFLEHALKNLVYPKFTGTLEKKKEHTFVIVFYSE